MSLVSSARADSKLDIGAEYRLRGLQFNNATYTSEPVVAPAPTVVNPAATTTQYTGKTNQSYYSNRARVYLKAKLDPGIEIGSVLQAIGVQGSTFALVNRYPKEDFTPFVENAYITANEMFDWPVSVTLGRQPYTWGSGLIVSDDGLGFNGIRLDAGPFWGLRTHLFTAKAKDYVRPGDSDLYLAGLSYNWGIHNIRFGWIMDRDTTGTPYSNLNIANTSTPSVATSEISRQYYNIQVEGHLEKGAFYNVEYAMQMGRVNFAAPTVAPAPGQTLNPGDPGTEMTLSGSALTFEGGFDFVHPRWRRMILAFVFMQGSGDQSSSRGEDERFNAPFGHRYDGLERVGAGEFFAATPYSFFNQDRVRVNTPIIGGAPGSTQTYPYESLFSGLRTFGFRGSVNPLEPLVMGLEFYIFTARETPDIRNNAPTTINDNELGRELVFSAHYNYAKRVNVGIRWGKFFPSANLNNVGSYRLMFEASARF